MKTLNIHITGRVQGVFFRATAQEEAEKLGITGWARNEPDGSVAILAQGDAAPLEVFLEWCHVGPTSAQVEHVEIEEVENAVIKKEFEIKH